MKLNWLDGQLLGNPSTGPGPQLRSSLSSRRSEQFPVDHSGDVLVLMMNHR